MLRCLVSVWGSTGLRTISSAGGGSTDDLEGVVQDMEGLEQPVATGQQPKQKENKKATGKSKDGKKDKDKPSRRESTGSRASKKSRTKG